MTTPDERTRALRGTRAFLEDLCDRKHTPDVPDAVREQARWWLRHYPGDGTLKFLAQFVPQALSPPPPGGDRE